jgi:hypothetical protein
MIRLDPAPEARWRRPGLRALLPRLARHTLASAVLLALASVATPPMLRAQTVPKFEILDSPIQLDGLARPRVYLGGVGRHAAFFGEETGSFEAWSWPVKLFHDFRLTFKIPDYTEPIPGASVARRVIVRPELMTVIYSHATFTVQQHFLVPLHEPGMIVLLDVSAVNALEIVASFRADLDLMWPAGIGGQYAYYDAGNRRFILSESRDGGLHASGPRHARRAVRLPHRRGHDGYTHAVHPDRHRRRHHAARLGNRPLRAAS